MWSSLTGIYTTTTHQISPKNAVSEWYGNNTTTTTDSFPTSSIKDNIINEKAAS